MEYVSGLLNFFFRHKNLPIGVLDTDRLFLLLLNVTFPDANEDADQEE